MFVGCIQNNSTGQYRMLNSLVKRQRVKKECVHITDAFKNLKNIILQQIDVAILKSEISKKVTVIKTIIYACSKRRGVSFSHGDK